MRGGTGSGYQAQLQRMIDDIRSWWTVTYPALYGRPYTDLAGGVIRVTTEDVRVPACGGGRPPRYRDIAGNAYYCRDTADYIAYDDSTLFPRIEKRYGVVSLGLVMAHEWGHAIQARAGVNGSTILLEQQADCFAGAWLAHVAKDRPSGITFGDADLTGAMGGFLSYADPIGTTAQQSGAHGSGFDRVGAFQDGYTNGAKRCVGYATSLPPVFSLPFGSQDDFASGGNLPFEQVQPLMVADLDRFWTAKVSGFPALAGKVTDAASIARCNGTSGANAADDTVVWCTDAAVVGYDPAFLRRVYEEGDFAVGMLFGHAWAQAAQAVRKQPVTGRSALLQADCYVGAWTRSTIAQLRENQDADAARKLSLSPGDLDEGVRGLLTFGNEIGRDPTSAGPFDRIAAFRQGVLGGLSACPA
jgi:predicted metalloprotease